jgi:hypothetical protein
MHKFWNAHVKMKIYVYKWILVQNFKTIWILFLIIILHWIIIVIVEEYISMLSQIYYKLCVLIQVVL